MTDQNYPKVYLYRRIVQAKLFIDAHFTEPLKLENMAVEACFSRFHFIRLFRQAYHKTPHQYLTCLRIEKAKDLLKDNHLTISQICLEVGFESAGSFSSLFRKYTSHSPSQYREKAFQKMMIIRSQPLKVVPGCFASSKGWI